MLQWQQESNLAIENRLPELRNIVMKSLSSLQCKEAIRWPETLDGLHSVLNCIPASHYDDVIELINNSCNVEIALSAGGNDQVKLSH